MGATFGTAIAQSGQSMYRLRIMDANKIKNMEEFALLSGISRPTLSKYFNDPDSVRSSTRTKIEAAIKRFNYRPNIYAMNQNRRLTKNIGIVVPYLADPFFAEIARNIEKLIIEAGFRPILLSSHGEPAQEVDNLEGLRSIKPAGVLLAPLDRSANRKVLENFCSEVPTVLFDCNVDGIGEAFVGSDNMQSIDLIVEYLCSTGEPPIFFEMRNPVNPNALKRRHAYVAAMERRGLEPYLLQADAKGWDFEKIGYDEGRRLISSKALPGTSILCSNDRLAIGFLAAAYEMGLRVGRGEGSALRLAGHDDHPFSRFTSPTLTTVAQDYGQIARDSAEVLFDLIETGYQQQDRLMRLCAGKLVKRASA